MNDAVGMPSRVWRAFSLLAIVALLAPLALVSSPPASADDDDDELDEPIEIGYVETANLNQTEQLHLGTVTMQDRGEGITRFEYLHERQPDEPVRCDHPVHPGQPLQHGTVRVGWGFPADTLVAHGGTREFVGPNRYHWANSAFETSGMAETSGWGWKWDPSPDVRLVPGDRQWVDVRLPASFVLSDALDDPAFASAWGVWGYQPYDDPECPYIETHGEVTTFVSTTSAAEGLEGSWLPREEPLGRAVPAGETVPVRLLLDNKTGEPLTGVSVDEVEVVSLDEGGEATLVRDLSSEALRPSTVLAGSGPESVTHDDYLLTGDEPGRVELVAQLSGIDPDGQRVEGTVRNEFEVRPVSLLVEVEVRYPQPDDDGDGGDGGGDGDGDEGGSGPAGFQKDNNGDGVIDEADHRIEVVVTATNQTDETLREVGPVADDDRVVRFSNRLVGDGQVSLTPIEEPHDLEFGDLEPEVPVERTYVYEAIGQVDAEVRALLEGVPDSGGVVRGVGVGEVKLRSDLAVEVEIAMEQRPYTSGDTVRLFGTARNLLIDGPDESGEGVEEAPDVAVVIFPIVEGNAANGHVLVGSGGGMTPIAEEPFVLASEEEVAVSAILVTQRTEASSQAGVRYLVRAWELGDDGEPAVEIDQSRIVISEEGAFSAEHETDLAAFDFTPDDVRECVTVVVDDIVTCNFYIGLRDMALGLWDLAQLIPAGIVEMRAAEERVAAWGLKQLTDAVLAVVGDPAAQQALITELEVQLATLEELGIMTREAGESVGDAVGRTLQEAEQVIASGDGDAMLAFFSRQAGENIDVTLGGLVKLRTLATISRSNADAAARTAGANAVREAREQAAREAQDSIEQRVRDARARGEDPATNGTFRGNEDVTDLPSVTRGVYGTDTKTLENLRSIAQSENVVIGWRGRSPIVAELYRLGQIYLKPMDVKAKTVNVIDVNYLGYRRSSMGTVELTEPPIDYRLAAPGNELAFQQAIDDHMATLRNRHPEIGADPLWEAEVRKRLELRTKEYPKQLREFQRYHYEGIKLEFGYDQQGLTGPHAAEVAELRNARIKQVVAQGDDGVTRRYLELEMDGPGNNGAYRQIGGDTDVVVIQNPDGTPITDQAKRRRIYEALQEQIGMQHGETMSYINAEVQTKLLRDHVAGRPGSEGLLVAGSDGRVRIGYLEETFSSKLGPDGEPAGSIFNLVSGAPAELLSSPTIGQGASFAGYLERLDSYMSRLPFYLPGRLAQLASGLSEDQLAPTFDNDGQLLQPDGRGGLTLYRINWEHLEPQTEQINATPDIQPMNDDPDGALIDQLVDEAADAGLLPDGPPEVGAAGGRWVPIDVEDALDDDGMLVLAPTTTLTHDVEAGDDYLPINDAAAMGMTDNGDWFAPGDRIVLDPGGHNEEFATVQALGSLILTEPLTNTHETGTAILRLTGASDDDGDGDGGDGDGDGSGGGSGSGPGGDGGSGGDGGATDDSDTTGEGSASGGQDDTIAGDGSGDERQGRAGTNVRSSGDTRAGDTAGRTDLPRTGTGTSALLALAAIMLTFGATLTRRRTSATIGRFRVTSGTAVSATERTHSRESADPGPVTLT